jgi:hypothetical protein
MLLCLLIQSWNFALEKSLYQDSAYLMFQILNDSSIPVEHFRFSGSIPHIPAWFGILMGFEASTVFKLFSSGPWLLQLIVFGFFMFLRMPREGLIQVISLLWSTREAMFITTEVPVAMSSALLLSAAFRLKEVFPPRLGSLPIVAFQILLGFSGVLGAVFAHPVGIVFLLFVLGWHLVESKFSLKPTLLFSAILVGGVVFRMLFFKTSGYENSYLAQTFSDLSWLRNIQETYSFHFFMHAHRKMYLFLALFWLYVLLQFRKDRTNKLKFWYSLLSVIGLWFLVIGTFREGDSNGIMEKNFYLVTLPMLFVFINHVWDEKTAQLKFGFMFLFWIISLWSVRGIGKSSIILTQRVDTLERLVTVAQKTGHGKWYLEDESMDKSKWHSTWALPYETLLMSAHLNGKGIVTVKNIYSDNMFTPELDKIYGADFAPSFEAKDLNPRFFMIRHNEPYKKWEE